MVANPQAPRTSPFAPRTSALAPRPPLTPPHPTFTLALVLALALTFTFPPSPSPSRPRPRAQAGVVVSGGSFSTWAVAEESKLPPVGPPGAPPPDAAEENVRPSGGRGVAKSAGRSQGEAAGAVGAAGAASALRPRWRIGPRLRRTAVRLSTASCPRMQPTGAPCESPSIDSDRPVFCRRCVAPVPKG